MNETVPLRGAGPRLLLAILVVALNLRGAITCVGPLLEMIQREVGLSGTAAGLLTSLPLFAFGLLSPYAAPLARRVGIELAIFLSMLVLLLGLGLRYLPGTFNLYLGTGLIGIGIAISNVLLPGLLRRDYAHSLPLVTAFFTTVLVTVGGLGSALSVPFAALSNWRFSLVVWALPALLALVVWAPFLRQNSRPSTTTEHQVSVWRSALAWQVSLFMGCQSTAFYVMIAWLPSMLSDLEGMSAARVGWILFIYQLFVLASVMLVPLLIQRLRDQRMIGIGCAGLILIGFCGLYLTPARALLWMSIMGLGAGGSLVLALTLFGLRASTTSQAVGLSGMAQTVGYLMAALTPILIGFIHDSSDSWQLPLILMIMISTLHLAMGYLAGRPHTVN